MEHTSRKSRLAPQQLREELLKRGNKETGAKTQPSKLTNAEKFDCARNYYEKTSFKNAFHEAYVRCFMDIYGDKSFVEETEQPLLGVAGIYAREQLAWMEKEPKKVGIVPFRATADPLAKLVEAEERING